MGCGLGLGLGLSSCSSFKEGWKPKPKPEPCGVGGACHGDLMLINSPMLSMQSGLALVKGVALVFWAKAFGLGCFDWLWFSSLSSVELVLVI